MKYNRRQFTRINIQRAVILDFGKKKYEHSVSNFSLGGMYIQGGFQQEVGDTCTMTLIASDIDPDAKTAVCCGPNTVYFSQKAKLCEMVDHIYGRSPLPLQSDRPHMFLKELSLHLDGLKKEVAKRKLELESCNCNTDGVKENLMTGIRHYRELASQLVEDQRDGFSVRLESLRSDLDKIT